MSKSKSEFTDTRATDYSCKSHETHVQREASRADASRAVQARRYTVILLGLDGVAKAQCNSHAKIAAYADIKDRRTACINV